MSKFVGDDLLRGNFSAAGLAARKPSHSVAGGLLTILRGNCV
jgi:hypothetical protein